MNQNTSFHVCVMCLFCKAGRCGLEVGKLARAALKSWMSNVPSYTCQIQQWTVQNFGSCIYFRTFSIFFFFFLASCNYFFIEDSKTSCWGKGGSHELLIQGNCKRELFFHFPTLKKNNPTIKFYEVKRDVWAHLAFPHPDSKHYLIEQK